MAELKDRVKINARRDRKQIQNEEQNVRKLIAEGLYPEKFYFPLTVQMELTTHCNVFCKHCYNASGTDNEAVDEMTAEKWIDFANYLVKQGGIFQCVISGGEPLLLGDKLYEIMDILHNDGTSFLLITNGFLLTPEKVKKLSKYRFKWLQVSIDGANPQYHDSFRRRNGSWERATQGAFLVSKAGIPLTIAHTVTPDNLKDIDEMCVLAYSLGAGSIIVGEVNPSGRSAYDQTLILSYEQKNILQERIEINNLKYRGKMEVIRSSNVKNQLLRYKGLPNSGVIIRPNGDVRIDCMAPFILGNFLKEDFAGLWQSKADFCWNHPLVEEYIQGFDEITDINDAKKNYVGKDTLI